MNNRYLKRWQHKDRELVMQTAHKVPRRIGWVLGGFVGESGLTGETPVLGVPSGARVGDGVGWEAWKLGMVL